MKIGIVGAAIAEGDLIRRSINYDELWSVNNLFRGFSNVEFSRWFELHQFQCIKGVFYRRGRNQFGRYANINRYLRDLDVLGIPILMRRKYKRIKLSQAFPFRRLMKEYGQYFGCSFAWLVAYAIEQGADEIGFFGVTLEGNEYYYQRPSTEYMVGIAKGMGVKISIDESSQLLKGNYIYAYKENFDLIYLLHGELSKELTSIILTAVQQRADNLGEAWTDELILR